MAVAIFVYPFFCASPRQPVCFVFAVVVVVFIDDTDRFLRAAIFAEKKGSGLVRNTSANFELCVGLCFLLRNMEMIGI